MNIHGGSMHWLSSNFEKNYQILSVIKMIKFEHRHDRIFTKQFTDANCLLKFAIMAVNSRVHNC